MVIIYNTIGLIFAAAAAVLAALVFAVLGGGRFGLLFIMFGSFAAAFDLWYRGKHGRRWFAPTGGGSFFFLPLWGFAAAVSFLGVLMLIVPPRDRNRNGAPMAARTTTRNGVEAASQSLTNAASTDATSSGQQPAESARRPAVSPSTSVTGNDARSEHDGIAPPQLPFPEPPPTFGTSPIALGDVDASTPLEEGQEIQAYWDNRWFHAKILSALDDGRVKIRVTGWGDASVATVERNVLKQPEKPVSSLEARTPQTSDKSASGVGEIDASTPLEVGQKLETTWGSSWYESEVTSLLDDGTVKIHYTGWSSNFDEIVDRNRLRNPRGIVGPGGRRD